MEAEEAEGGVRRSPSRCGGWWAVNGVRRQSLFTNGSLTSELLYQRILREMEEEGVVSREGDIKTARKEFAKG